MPPQTTDDNSDSAGRHPSIRSRARVYPLPPNLPRHTLDRAGHHIEVEVGAVKLTNTARLFIDGQQIDEQHASLGDRTRFQWNGSAIVVQWGWWSGQVMKCVLVEERDPGNAQPKIDETPFAPPPGTRAAKLAQFRHEHPALYAMRHVVRATLQVALPLLGLGALFTALLPQVDWAWAAELGVFIRALRMQIGAWLPDVSLPLPSPRAWIMWIVTSPWFIWGKWILPIIIAIFVAIEEVQRHKRRQHNEHATKASASTDGSIHQDGQDQGQRRCSKARGPRRHTPVRSSPTTRCKRRRRRRQKSYRWSRSASH